MGRDVDAMPKVKVLGMPASLLAALLGGVLGLLCIVVGILLYDSRAQELKRASVEAANLSTVITQDIARNLELLDLSIQAVIDGVGDERVMASPPDLRQMILFDRAATAPYLGALLVIDASGRVVIDSRMETTALANYADRDYFIAHRLRPDVGLYVSKPLISRSDGHAIIGLSRRITKPDGSFGGVVVGTLHLDYLQNLFSKMTLHAGGSLTLFRTDGAVVMRAPYDAALIGKVLKPVILFDRLAKAPEGEYEATSVIDGIKRLYHYQQIGNMPLVQNVALSLDDIYADWWRKAATTTIVLAGCCLIIGALALGLKNELRRRMAAEARLVLLASEDGLTGLANRRTFDEALIAAWRQAVQDATPLALLMIDADHFKHYNDKFGHVAGDAALQALGGCLKRKARRAGELAARYGGEEFAVLLPHADAVNAMAIAEAIRREIGTLSPSYPTPGRERLSVSVGVAAFMPNAAGAPSDLIKAADTALYASKAGGRDRSTFAPENQKVLERPALA